RLSGGIRNARKAWPGARTIAERASRPMACLSSPNHHRKPRDLFGLGRGTDSLTARDLSLTLACLPFGTLARSGSCVQGQKRTEADQRCKRWCGGEPSRQEEVQGMHPARARPCQVKRFIARIPCRGQTDDAAKPTQGHPRFAARLPVESGCTER